MLLLVDYYLHARFWYLQSAKNIHTILYKQ